MPRSPRLAHKAPVISVMQGRIGEDEKTLALDQEVKLFAFGKNVILFMVTNIKHKGLQRTANEYAEEEKNVGSIKT